MQYTRRDAQLFFDFLKKIVYSHERYYLATGEMKMKLLIFSDSHRANITDMLALIDEEKPDAVAHLGDLVCDVEDIRFVYPELPVYSVRGNNDWGDDETPNSLVVCAERVRLFLTHGHLFGVRRNTKRLTQEAQQAGCQVALYGHTHRAEGHAEAGVVVAKPGSISMPYTAQPPSYLRLTIAGDRVQPELIYLKNTKKKRLWL